MKWELAFRLLAGGNVAHSGEFREPRVLDDGLVGHDQAAAVTHELGKALDGRVVEPPALATRRTFTFALPAFSCSGVTRATGRCASSMALYAPRNERSENSAG